LPTRAVYILVGDTCSLQFEHPDHQTLGSALTHIYGPSRVLDRDDPDIESAHGIHQVPSSPSTDEPWRSREVAYVVEPMVHAAKRDLVLLGCGMLEDCWVEKVEGVLDEVVLSGCDVRKRQKKDAVVLQDTMHLAKRKEIIGNVLERRYRDDRLNAIVGERQCV
jgi:hypothetical protein